MAVAILSLPTGLDFADYSPQYQTTGLVNSHAVSFSLDQSMDDLSVKPLKLMHIDSNLNLAGLGSSNSNSITIPQQGEIDSLCRENFNVRPTFPLKLHCQTNNSGCDPI